MSYVLESGSPKDLETIVALLLEQYHEIGTFRLCLPAAREGILDVLENGHGLLLRDGARLVGYLGLYHYTAWYSDEVALADRGLFIHRDHRSLATFGMLMNGARGIARLEGRQLYLFLNSPEPGRKERLFSRYGDEVLKGYRFEPFGGMYRMRG